MTTQTTSPPEFIANFFENLSNTPLPDYIDEQETPEDETEFIEHPLIAATAILEKVEAMADDFTSEEKVVILLKVADRHIEIGKQLLDDFER